MVYKVESNTGITLPQKNKLVIKKYANRRLYNTASSSYITLEELSELIKKGYDIEVFDAKTNENLTSVTLTQIILEHETRGYQLLPIDCLKQVIRLYDHKMAEGFRNYMTWSIQYFHDNQENIQKFTDTIPASTIVFPGDWAKAWGDFTQHSTDFLQTMVKNATNFNFKPDKPK